MAAAKSFERVTVQMNKTAPAYVAYIAIWHNRGRGEVVIGAPSLDQLASRWEQITNSDLDRVTAQEVWVCSGHHAHETEVKP